MFSTKFVYILTPRYLTLIWLNQPDIVFNLNYIFKSPSNFFCLDLRLRFMFFQLSETFCICLFSFQYAYLGIISWHYGWWNELVSPAVGRKWYIFRNIYFVIKICNILSWLKLYWSFSYRITVKPVQKTTSIKRPLIWDDQCWVCSSKSPHSCYSISQLMRLPTTFFASQMKICLKQPIQNFTQWRNEK